MAEFSKGLGLPVSLGFVKWIIAVTGTSFNPVGLVACCRRLPILDVPNAPIAFPAHFGAISNYENPRSGAVRSQAKAALLGVIVQNETLIGQLGAFSKTVREIAFSTCRIGHDLNPRESALSSP